MPFFAGFRTNEGSSPSSMLRVENMFSPRAGVGPSFSSSGLLGDGDLALARCSTFGYLWQDAS